MKKTLLIISILFTGLFLNAQTVSIDSNGNYVQTRDTASNFKPLGKTYTDSKGIVYPVFISKAGKLFVFRISRNTGKEYRYYLTAKL